MMIALELRTFVEEYWDAISGKAKTPALLGKYVADQHLIEHAMAFESAFPRYELKAEEFICEGDKVSVIARASGTHQGDLMGIQPTGKKINIPLSVIYKIKDDKIVKSWLFYDSLEIMKQLGVASKN